jgi:hypothetical protein
MQSSPLLSDKFFTKFALYINEAKKIVKLLLHSRNNFGELPGRKLERSKKSKIYKITRVKDLT